MNLHKIIRGNVDFFSIVARFSLSGMLADRNDPINADAAAKYQALLNAYLISFALFASVSIDCCLNDPVACDLMRVALAVNVKNTSIEKCLDLDTNRLKNDRSSRNASLCFGSSFQTAPSETPIKCMQHGANSNVLCHIVFSVYRHWLIILLPQSTKNHNRTLFKLQNIHSLEYQNRASWNQRL